MKLLNIFSDNSARRRQRSSAENGSRSVGTNTKDDTLSDAEEARSIQDEEYRPDSEATGDSRSLRSISSTSSFKKSLKQRFSFRSISSSSTKREFSREKSMSLPASCRSKHPKKTQQINADTSFDSSTVSQKENDPGLNDCYNTASEKDSWVSEVFSDITLKGEETRASSSSTLEGEPVYSNGHIIVVASRNTAPAHETDEHWNQSHSSISQCDVGTPLSDHTLVGESTQSLASIEPSVKKPPEPRPSSSLASSPSCAQRVHILNHVINSIYKSSDRDNRKELPDQLNSANLLETSQHSPGSSGRSGSGDSGVETQEPQGDHCTACNISFPTREKLCEHWTVLHKSQSISETETNYVETSDKNELKSEGNLQMNYVDKSDGLQFKVNLLFYCH